MASSIIRNFIAKKIFQQKGAIANRKSVDFSANALEQRLTRLGVDTRQISSEKELNQLLAYVKQMEDQAFNQEFSGILKANKFQKNADIIDFPQKRSFKQEVDDMVKDGTITKGTAPKQSDKVRTRQMFKDSNLNKTEAELKTKFDKENQESIQRFKDKMKDNPEDFADGGVAGLLGERPGYAIGNMVDQEDLGLGNLAEEDEYDFSDIEGQTAFVGLPEIFALGTKVIGPMLKGGSASAILKNAAKEKLRQEIGKKIYKGIQKKINKPKYGTKGPTTTTTTKPGGGGNVISGGGGNKDFSVSGPNISANPTGKSNRASQARGYALHGADGGLANFANGGPARQNFKMGKRAFLKAMLGTGAGIAGLKSGLFATGGKEVTKKAVTETVKQSASTPPPYFFKLAEKIKKLGSDTTPTNDRTIAKSLKSKDGRSDYILEEDVASGDTIIKKVNKEGDEMITDVQIMELRKGEVVRGKDGKPKKTPDEYEEVTEANARIEGDVYNDPYYSDGIEVDEMKKIIDEVDDKVPSIKYATGGRVPYFKGGLAALKTLMNYFAKEKGTTGSKLLSDINPKKIDSGIKNLMSKEELNQLKENRTEYVKHLLNIIKSDKKFLDNNRAIVEETIAQAPIGMEDIAKEISDSIKRNAMKENRLERLSVYDKVNPDDAIMDVEMMIKNMSTGKKDKRALNAKGGLAYMLGE